MRKVVLLLLCALTMCVLLAGPAGAYIKRLEVFTFCCPCSVDNHLCQEHFNAINNQGGNKIICMGSDAHYSEIQARGNFLGIYYNSLNDPGYLQRTATQKADDIEAWVNTQFPSVWCTWIVINEISNGAWPNNQTYRTWVKDVCARLKNYYGHKVVICSPFANPGANDASWQALRDNCEAIGVENYLSGQEVNASGNSVSWCQSQYQSSVNSYAARGVPKSKLFLVEHFAHTLTNTGWGRAGVSYAGWDNAIITRSTAARNVGFTGFVSYAWGGNAMLVSDTDMIHFMTTYVNQTLP